MRLAKVPTCSRCVEVWEPTGLGVPCERQIPEDCPRLEEPWLGFRLLEALRSYRVMQATNHLPRAGGTYDQSRYFIDVTLAVREIENERDEAVADRHRKKMEKAAREAK